MRLITKPAFIIAAGLVLILSGFLYDVAFAGLPYPDPTPDLQANWLFYKEIASWIMRLGAGFMVIGSALFVI